MVLVHTLSLRWGLLMFSFSMCWIHDLGTSVFVTRTTISNRFCVIEVMFNPLGSKFMFGSFLLVISILSYGWFIFYHMLHKNTIEVLIIGSGYFSRYSIVLQTTNMLMYAQVQNFTSCGRYILYLMFLWLNFAYLK